MACTLRDAPRPVRPKRKQRSAFAPEKLPPMDLCDPCGQRTFTTVCNICLKCASEVTARVRAEAGRMVPA